MYTHEGYPQQTSTSSGSDNEQKQASRHRIECAFRAPMPMLPVERETNNRYKEHTHVAAALIRCAASSWTLFNLLLASLRSPFAFLSLHAKFVVSFQHTDIPLPIEIHFLVPWGFVLLVGGMTLFCCSMSSSPEASMETARPSLAVFWDVC
jgi:hypothetical protein